MLVHWQGYFPPPLDLSSIHACALILRQVATVIVLFVLVPRGEKLVHGGVAVRGAVRRMAMVLCLLAKIFGEEMGEAGLHDSGGVQYLLHVLGEVVTVARHR
jgi:hypothetical protein